MCTILLLSSSPRGSASYSKQIAESVISDLRKRHPNANLILRDLAQAPLPHIDDDFVTATRILDVINRYAGGRYRCFSGFVLPAGFAYARLLAPTSCLTAHLYSFGRTFAFHRFAPSPCGDDLAVRLRSSQAPVGNLSSR